VWDNPTTYAVLDGYQGYGVNAAGTVVVGSRNSSPAYWYRTPSGSWTTTGTNLPTVGGSCSGGFATAMSGAGLIAGFSCGGKGSATVATVWQLDLSGGTPVLLGTPMAFGGFGPGANSTKAVAISYSPPYVVVGYIDSGSNVAVRWSLP
jgi:hypothetical protein